MGSAGGRGEGRGRWGGGGCQGWGKGERRKESVGIRRRLAKERNGERRRKGNGNWKRGVVAPLTLNNTQPQASHTADYKQNVETFKTPLKSIARFRIWWADAPTAGPSASHASTSGVTSLHESTTPGPGVSYDVSIVRPQ